MITTKSTYGLLFLIDLVDSAGSGPIDLATIALRQGMPEAYLAKLIAPLKAAGILHSSRGAKGGYELARAAESVTILEIVEALEGRSSLVGSGLGLEALEGRPAESAEGRVQGLWKALDRAVRSQLSGTTLAEAAGARGIEYHI